MNRRRALAALAGLAALPLLAACPGGTSTADQTDGGKPDCDFDDLLEGDKDCDPKPASSKAADTKEPKPRKTKRTP